MQLIQRIALSIFIVFLCCPAFCALSASTVWEVRNGGDDTNGGGWVTGASGTDWSQQTSPQYSVTDGVTAGTTTITSATANFGTDVVGNIMYVQGGTGSVTAGWYQITARGSASSITVDRSTGLTAGTGVTLKIGGCFATPGRASSLMAVAGQKTWWKYHASNFVVSTATPGPAGPITFPSVACTLQGYDATRGDDTGNRPCIEWGSALAGDGAFLVTFASNQLQTVHNIKVDGGGDTVANGVSMPAGSSLLNNCVITDLPGSGGSHGIGVSVAGSSTASNCRVDNCLTGFGIAGVVTNSVATACATGFNLSSAGAFVDRCLAYANTGDGFISSATSALSNCTSSGNGDDGFHTGTVRVALTNCASTFNTGYAVNASSAQTMRLLRFADYSNTAGRTNSAAFLDDSPVGTISADPWVAKASGDFRPNDTAGAGALLRGAALGVFGQTDNQDVGAVQHADPSGAASDNGVIY